MARRAWADHMPLSMAHGHIGRLVNIWALVMEFEIPKMSQGTDFVCVLKIMDMSNKELSANVFNPVRDCLPHVKSNGDIIHLRDVPIEFRNGAVYACFRKKFSSFSLFEGRSHNFTPYQSYSGSDAAVSEIELTNKEEDLITNLRNWFGDFEFEIGNDKYVLPLKKIGDVKKNEDVDLILHSHRVSEESTDVFVWDGTDAPPISELIQDGEALQETCLERWPFLPRDVIREFPSIGSVIKLNIGKWFAEFESRLQRWNWGPWFKFRGVKLYPRSGFWEGFVVDKSKICPLSVDDYRVVFCQISYEQRTSSTFGRMPSFCFARQSYVARIDGERKQLPTLREILTHLEDPDTFTCIVRVVGRHPLHAKDIHALLPGFSKYAWKMTLEDPTARIDAYFDAEKDKSFKELAEAVRPFMLDRFMKMLLGTIGSPGSGDGDSGVPWMAHTIDLLAYQDGARQYIIRKIEWLK
ncbi:protection of telomeres protein 1a isoform X2 [Amborella trichopoda]|uniref:protection of telomeres protein 1a isoform X2 n=1 Tax=Amborella trichopoda TaxID=13333 RepID=UPI0009C038D9|nr:protection of telomeres protein 1a isoform X2 [Amborella trichopoda]|eukprot:XP_020518866.1 protection of telomeres protein 1a isoform X2 [Amborella trichopoda]